MLVPLSCNKEIIMQLTKRENQIMQVVWQLKKAFIRDIVEAMPAPKPHYNTVATIVKILVKKGVLKSEMLGNTHQYSPTIDYKEYQENHLTDIKKKYFGNSLSKLVAYYAKDENLSDVEVEELIKIIKSKKD